MTTELRITVKNTSETGGTFLTPVYFGFHDGSFDLFEVGQAASAGLESLAEDGSAAALATERVAADADSQGIVVTGAGGPVATQEVTDARITVDGASNGSVSLAAMILPSNDAFIGTDDAVALFDGGGDFQGAQVFSFAGTDVYDAGTEFNTEVEAAFLNQTGPNTGDTEGGVVALHPGFNGSEGNPDGSLGNPDGVPGAQNVIGGTNAAMADITTEADFTRAGAQIAEIHINTVLDRAVTDGNDLVLGRRNDDIVAGSDGNDRLYGARGWDVLDGGAGNDRILGGQGDDWLSGGTDRDFLSGGLGDDTFFYSEGDGLDRIVDLGRGDDRIVLDVDGVDSFTDLAALASARGARTWIDFGDGDVLFLTGTQLADLNADDFVFI